MDKKTFANEQEAAEYLCSKLGERLMGMDYMREESAYFVYTKTERTWKDMHGKTQIAGDNGNYYYISINNEGRAFVREEIEYEVYSEKEELTEFVERVREELIDTFGENLKFDPWE